MTPIISPRQVGGKYRDGVRRENEHEADDTIAQSRFGLFHFFAIPPRGHPQIPRVHIKTNEDDSDETEYHPNNQTRDERGWYWPAESGSLRTGRGAQLAIHFRVKQLRPRD